MKRSLWRKLDSVARNMVPCALTTSLLFAGVIPLHNSVLQSVAPSLPLIAVFYWTLYRPDLMPPVAVFAIGVLHDILVGLPIGVTACVLVCVHAAVSTQRRFFSGKSFGVLWLGFAVVATAGLLLGWLLTCVYYATLVTPDRMAFQILTTIGCFPILCWLLLRCQVVLLERA
ncbi:MAG TPA: rod shape-determining protein MreD [Rhodospirillales bacterium]|nr:rod shape-determining protein MreD [Rhodospirillales bacterium]